MIYEYFSYLCTRKHETGAVLRATLPCFLVRRSTRNGSSACKSTEIFPNHLIFSPKINAIRTKTDIKKK